ncbi:hypothetical protein OROGR_017010 [Orobanche gracilis]
MAEIEIKTAPADFRFPTTNQTRHCFTRYIEFHSVLYERKCILELVRHYVTQNWKSSYELSGQFYVLFHSLPMLGCPSAIQLSVNLRCVAAKGEESNDCGKFAKYYRSLCPGEWIDKWNEQRENGTFPGPL